MYSIISLKNKNKNLDSINISNSQNSKPKLKLKSLYAINGFKKKKDLFSTLFSKNENLSNLNSRNKYNTYNLNNFKNLSEKKDIYKPESKNKTMRNLFKCKSENNISEKTNNIENNKNNNFLLLTSLYKLPIIKSKIKLCKKPNPIIFPGTTINNNNFISPPNSSSMTSKKHFNDSISSSYNESFNNYFNLRYSNETNKNNSIELNQSNQSNGSKTKKKIFSNLMASLKDKYYADVEKRYNHKLDERLFPSDHSIKDKIIYMKKVGIFWNSVFKYCVPIINGRKYKLQHQHLEENKLKNLKLNTSQSHSNYYDIFVKDHNYYKVRLNKSLSKML
jgi:hypothetical protein